ncbi:hypothetical protein MOMA_06911 [Moraxella macacae 0408225]|uniref:RNA polymerase n=1 Tax=Moraxella macacae 0408225 TaxID=1230338 RepID=L2F5H1_9GAMM|nr:hypothetical protein [Moraxella macacae]ELA08272.1 hypothetical protein MOMA_06911 [Moraxella macacae 0408225]
MNQSQIEKLLHIKHLENELKTDISNSYESEIIKAKQAIIKWCNIKEWDSKNDRKYFVSFLDLNSLILNILTKTVLYCQKPMPFVSIASMINIGFTDKMDNIRTVSELLALLEPMGIYTIDDNRMIEALIMPSKELETKLHHACFIPPMIEKPDTLYRNNDCGLKTIDKDSLILGFNENYHTKNISLDVLNTLNNNEYELDMYIISNFEKPVVANTELELTTWENFKEQFTVFVKHLTDKTFYLTHKVDKRGRVYSQGYHFNTQGSSFEKACINLKHKELITGEL